MKKVITVLMVLAIQLIFVRAYTRVTEQIKGVGGEKKKVLAHISLDSFFFYKCQEKLFEKFFCLDIYEKPDKKSTKLGTIVKKQAIEGCDFLWEDEKGKQEVFKVDQVRNDSTVCLQTALEINGSWVKLPLKPFPEPVWIDTSKPDSKAFILNYVSKNPFRYAQNDYCIRLEKDVLVFDVNNKSKQKTFKKGSEILVTEFKDGYVTFREFNSELELTEFQALPENELRNVMSREELSKMSKEELRRAVEMMEDRINEKLRTMPRYRAKYEDFCDKDGHLMISLVNYAG